MPHELIEQAFWAGYRYHLTMERLQDHVEGEPDPPGSAQLLMQQFDQWRALTMQAAQTLEET